MIEIILYWILSNVDAPIFVWAAYWIHIIAIVLKFISSLLKKSLDVNLKNIGKDEEF